MNENYIAIDRSCTRKETAKNQKRMWS